MNTPIFVTDAGDGSSTLYVVSQAGFIYSIRDGALSDQPFLDISDRTSTTRQNGTYGERGLLGLAFHPEYERNGFFFVNYTDREGNTHISRFTRRSDADFLADPDSEAVVLFVAQPYPNHNGGGLSFGPDGFLYIALGDGGSGGDPLGSGQSLQTYLGKILRIDVDLGQPYAVPPTNPFAQGGGLPEIWAYGLRNPWRIAFDPLTGDLYIADVGQNAYEEVNFQPASSQGGENYGWNYREGSHIYIDTPAGVTGLVEPAAEYDHGLGCSITGGVVYRGLNLPEWQGVYLYGDYCSGRIWGLLSNPDRTWQQALLFETGFRISSFGTDRDGEVYVIDYGSGKLFRLDRR